MACQKHLLTGDIEKLNFDLKRIMEETVSTHDTARNPEAFYHGLFVGLTASLSTDKNYELYSNRESGYGRYDYMILSRDKNKLTIIMEFKRVDLPKDTDELEEKLETTAKEALTQINKNEYLPEIKKRDLHHILKIGLGFCGKKFKIHYEYN